MDGGGKRQLPSWMMRTTATEQASISETNKENIEGSVKLHTQAVEPQKKIKAKKNDAGVPLIEDELNLLKKCETRTRKRKLNKHDEGQEEKFHEDEPCSLKPCRESRSKRMPTKHSEDRVNDFLESDIEKKVDGEVRKRARENDPRKKRLKNSTEEGQNGTAESSSSEDELTVEDLVSIAEEYLKADKMECHKSKKMEFAPETKPQITSGSEIVLEKNYLTSNTEVKMVTDQPLSSGSSVTKPLSSEGSFLNPSTTREPGQDMLDLLLGPLLRKAGEVEKKTDAITDKNTLDYELSKIRSQNDTVAEVAPVMKKKFSLKERAGRLWD
ncbi:uncharacterized protein LOC110702022 [Chenopodium quinoa]|uniref:Uncharacterized protein n=1 Tax=Chenopodium quinoa TaxID=63459 RepID=A0A803LRR5_CHEQI|nr:uncharacterized protein LOC110702022 [Chenopodium quinoa]